MKLAWVTGASKGLGKALCEHLLNQGWIVTGISRHNSIENEHFTQIVCDLSLPGNMAAVQFEALNASELLLVNNAGALGEIGAVGSISDDEMIHTVSLNLTAAAVLTNRFLKQTQYVDCKKTILNISSGAGRNAYDGWAVYCSTKAGLDMFSSAVAKELQINGNQHTRIFSIAPGVIDTQMQEQIRTANSAQFSNVERFRKMHHDELLISPEIVAHQLVAFISKRDQFSEVCLDVRNMEFR